MTSTFIAKADETTAAILDTVTKVQDATLEAVSTFTANLPEAPKVPAFEIPGVELPKFDLPKVDVPSATEVAAAFYEIVDKLVEGQKNFVANLPEAPKVPAFEIPGFDAPSVELPEAGPADHRRGHRCVLQRRGSVRREQQVLHRALHRRRHPGRRLIALDVA